MSDNDRHGGEDHRSLSSIPPWFIVLQSGESMPPGSVADSVGLLPQPAGRGP
jgi:hypothetical protein